MDGVKEDEKIEITFRSITGDFKVRISPAETVKNIKIESFDRSPNLIRLFFKGKELENDWELSHYRIEDGDVVNAIVKDAPSNQPINSQSSSDTHSPNNTENSSSDIVIEFENPSFLLCMLISLILVVIWICGISDPSLLTSFNFSTLTIISILDGAWISSFINSYVNQQQQEEDNDERGGINTPIPDEEEDERKES